MNKPYTDYDSPWKEVLELFLPAFIEFFFPAAYQEIDWGRCWSEAPILLRLW